MQKSTGVRPRVRTAAWRVSLWSGVAFAIGTAVAFWFLQAFLANDIQSRADSWLTGELGVLADVAQRTPANRLYDVVLREVAELASREVPHDENTPGAMNRAVFFLETTPQNKLLLSTGAGNGLANLRAIQESGKDLGQPQTIYVPNFSVPFRVASRRLSTGEQVYLALSTSYERSVLRRLRIEFSVLWCIIISFGTAIVFVSTRRMLHKVQAIADTASLIGESNLRSRVQTQPGGDEIAYLSQAFNRMLDRVESSVQQLHTMSDSLAHDLRSPMTAMRGKLELALMGGSEALREDALILSIEQLDRLTSLVNTSLDLSEAAANALRLRKEPIDLTAVSRSLVDLYEPAFSQAGLTLRFVDDGSVWMTGDTSLIERMITNLLENALKHTARGETTELCVLLSEKEGACLKIRDNGAGFPPKVLSHIFERYVKGPGSEGHGLGLAFVAAVTRSHGGVIHAANERAGGARIDIWLPR